MVEFQISNLAVASSSLVHRSILRAIQQIILYLINIFIGIVFLQCGLVERLSKLSSATLND